MRGLSVIALVALFALAGVASAQNQFTLVYNPANGSASLENVTASALTLTGYGITSTGGNLIPTFNSSTGVGWNSLADQGLGGFVEGGAVSSSNLIEVSLAGLQLPVNTPQSIGRPITAGTSVSDLGFTFSIAGSGSLTGTVTVIPEPLTIATLVIGGLAVLRRRRR